MTYPTKFPEARAKIIAAMPGSQIELIERSGTTRAAVRWWLQQLREVEKNSHIVAWERNESGGPFVAIHGFGPGKDKRCYLKAVSRKPYRDKYDRNRRMVNILKKIGKSNPFAQLFI